MTKLANSLFSIVVLFLLLLCSSAEDSKLVRLDRSSFIWKDAKNCSAAQLEDLSFPLIHIQGKCSPFRLPNSTWWTSISNSIKGDTDRYRAIMKGGIWRSVVGRKKQNNANTMLNPQEDADVPLASAKTGNYIIKLGFGTPAQSFYTVVDTGSDIVWIPCSPCSDCSGQVFQPSKSPTFKYLGCASEACQTLGSDPTCGNYNCSFTEKYGDRSEVDQVLSSDALAAGSQSQTTKEFIFGCAVSRRGLIQSTPGLVGFGRGPLSFVSQTAMLYDSTFSYCLPSFFSSAFTGSLRLGKGALSSPGLKFTPLLSNAAQPSFYFVGLSGISVGKELVSVPGGTIIDSGTVITRLVEPAYTAMRDSFRRQLPGLTMAAPQRPFDTCYNIPTGTNIPLITFHFQNSVDMTLPLQNTLFPVNDMGSVLCLAFALPPEIGGSAVSIIGNYQQQDFRIVHDVPGSRLGIAPEKC